MSWASRVWGGPFRTPPLQHPITVGWVLLKILETIWRLVLVIALVAAAIGGFVWYSQENPLSSKVKVELNRPYPACTDPKYPVSVTLTNKTGKTLGEIDVAFHLYERGRTVDVASYSSRNIELRDIVPAGHWVRYCFRMPQSEAGSDGPFTVVAEVTYAAKVSKNVPITEAPGPPAPIITPTAPPPLVRTNIASNDSSTPAPPVRPKRTGLAKVGDVIGVLVLFILGASGGFGLLMLIDRIFRSRLADTLLIENEKKDNRGCVVLGVLGVTNWGLILASLNWLAAEGMKRLEEWSWSVGLADGAPLLFGGILAQWPWLVLAATMRFASQGSASSTVDA